MKLVEKNGLRILTSDEGKFLAEKDHSAVYDTTVYLGKFDTPDHFIDVSEEEKLAIYKELEEKRKAWEEERRASRKASRNK